MPIQYPLIVQFQIDWEDINFGRRNDCLACPGARAIGRRLTVMAQKLDDTDGDDQVFAHRVTLTAKYVSVWKNPLVRSAGEKLSAIGEWNTLLARAPVPLRLRRFMHAFDTVDRVQPMHFTIVLREVEPEVPGLPTPWC